MQFMFSFSWKTPWLIGISHLDDEQNLQSRGIWPFDGLSYVGCFSLPLNFTLNLETLAGTQNDPQWSRMFLFALII